MRQLILYIIFLMSMVFSGYGEVSAASTSFAHQDSFLQNSYLLPQILSISRILIPSRSIPTTRRKTDLRNCLPRRKTLLQNYLLRRKTAWWRLTTSKTNRQPSWRMPPLQPIGYAAVALSGSCHRATFTPRQVQVDCFLIESEFYHPFYPPYLVATSLSAWRVLLSTLMSPASIMSFACGISVVSFLFIIQYFMFRKAQKGFARDCRIPMQSNKLEKTDSYKDKEELWLRYNIWKWVPQWCHSTKSK